jgi:hypothetical protein
MRFGLYYVDYTSPLRLRYPKKSARWYADYVLAHSHGPALDSSSPQLPTLSAPVPAVSVKWSPFSSLWESFRHPEQFFLFGHFLLAP